MNIHITDDFEWSTDFPQSFSIECREYKFEQRVPLSKDAKTEEDEDNLRHF